MTLWTRLLPPVFAIWLGFNALDIHATTVRIAVAGNFAATLDTLVQKLLPSERDNISISSGATGTLYAQIQQGAPFDVLFAADSELPFRLVSEHLAEPSSLASYAIGQLVLAYVVDGDIGEGLAHLCTRLTNAETAQSSSTEVTFSSEPTTAITLAIANPALAPYGRAADQVRQKMEGMKKWRVVRGNGVLQANQFLVSGHAQAALISKTQALDLDPGQFAFCGLPQSLYDPIVQSRVIISNPQRTQNTMILIDKLLSAVASPSAAGLLQADGYLIPASSAVAAGRSK